MEISISGNLCSKGRDSEFGSKIQVLCAFLLRVAHSTFHCPPCLWASKFFKVPLAVGWQGLFILSFITKKFAKIIKFRQILNATCLSMSARISVWLRHTNDHILLVWRVHSSWDRSRCEEGLRWLPTSSDHFFVNENGSNNHARLGAQQPHVLLQPTPIFQSIWSSAMS